MILNNERGLKGKTSDPVVVPRTFLDAFFNIEQNYGNGETFNITENGKPKSFQLNHLTNADFQVATILLKVCTPAKGQIFQVNPYHIYLKLKEYFEDPISEASFYSSFEKFILHGLVSENYDEHSAKYNYSLEHYSNEQNNKIDFFVLLPPIVFTKEFTDLPIHYKKMFYSIYMSQGGRDVVREGGRLPERKLYSENSSVQFKGLCSFLHRKDPYYIKKMLDDMRKSTVDGKPLFETAYLEKSGSKYYKAVVSIYPDHLVPYTKGTGEEYHDTIDIPLVYRRKANFITKLLKENKIAEFVDINNGQEFKRFVRYMKNYGYRVIRFAIHRLKMYVDTYFKFPSDITQFLLKEIRNKTESIMIDIAVKTNVIDYIIAGTKGEASKMREFEFASKLSWYGPKAVEKACKKVLESLKKLYSGSPKEVLTVGDYSAHQMLDHIKEMEVVRRAAWRNQKNVRAYAKLEQEAVDTYRSQINNGTLDYKWFTEWMLGRVYELPSMELVPDLPAGFKLEEYLIKKQLIHAN